MKQRSGFCPSTLSFPAVNDFVIQPSESTCPVNAVAIMDNWTGLIYSRDIYI